MSERMEAAKRGETHYEGGQCGKCGNRLRYTSNATCVACSKEASKENVKRHSGLIRALLKRAKGERGSNEG